MLDKTILDRLFSKERLSFCQDPERWFIRHNLHEEWKYFSKMSFEEIKLDLLIQKKGKPRCVVCGKVHYLPHTVAFREWRKTCSKECWYKERSFRQLGNKNSSHKMSKETKLIRDKNLSNLMKEKILNGTFTPNTQNRYTHHMIDFFWNGEKRKVRSTWELIYWVNHPDLLYENIRIKYFDSKFGKERIYIADFFNKTTNTVVEIKPRKFIDQLHDKRNAVEKNGFSYMIVTGEDILGDYSPDLHKEILKMVIDKESFRRKMKWYGKDYKD